MLRELVGLVETPVLFFVICGPKFTTLSGLQRLRDCSLQRRFPFDCVLFHSGDICNHVAKFASSFDVLVKKSDRLECSAIFEPDFV